MVASFGEGIQDIRALAIIAQQSVCFIFQNRHLNCEGAGIPFGHSPQASTGKLEREKQ